MIDWITAIIPCHHDEKIYGGSIASVTLDGEIEWRVEKKQQVPGSHESNLNIKSLDNRHILFDGNPAKWLQGHNIFGSDNLVGLVEAVMLKLIPILNLTPTELDLQAWKVGAYDLKRVDCTAMWDLPRRADVRAWLRAAEMQSKSRHGRPVTTGGTLYFGKNSRRWSIKFYCKGDEIEARGHKLPDEIELRDKLIKYADNKLRGELTLVNKNIKQPKTKAGEREVKLFPPAIEALQNQKQFTFLENKRVFHNPQTNKAWETDAQIRRTLWIPALKQAGVAYRNPYQTRHTYASTLLSVGENPLWVAKQMGHKDWGMIRRVYGRWIPEIDNTAGSKIMKFWSQNGHKELLNG